MHTIELTLNTWSTDGFEPVSVDDPREIRELLGLKPREEVEGYAFTTNVNDGNGLAITTKGRCIPVPTGFFICQEDIPYDSAEAP